MHALNAIAAGERDAHRRAPGYAGAASGSDTRKRAPPPSSMV
jgi:hypothetical protein